MTEIRVYGDCRRQQSKSYAKMHAFLCNIAVLVCLAMLGSCTIAAAAPTSDNPTAEATNDIVFGDYSALAGSNEIIRRMLSPLAVAKIPSALARTHMQLAEQSVHLTDERFVLYVPQSPPPTGFGLLVFVPPWNQAEVPPSWLRVLDQFGLIFVSAARSGNDQSVIGRRVPLALEGEYNVAARYRLDPQRIYIAGFSGGSRAALRIALAYPDVFRGAILDAGGDPIGESDFPLPPRELFFRAQETMHVVFVAGDHDLQPAMRDRASMRSLMDWCISNVDSYTEPFLAHELMTAAALSRALSFLAAPSHTDPTNLSNCRSRIEENLDSQLKRTESMMKAGDHDEAHEKLLEIDAKFGGLAAPESVELLKSLELP